MFDKVLCTILLLAPFFSPRLVLCFLDKTGRVAFPVQLPEPPLLPERQPVIDIPYVRQRLLLHITGLVIGRPVLGAHGDDLVAACRGGGPADVPPSLEAFSVGHPLCRQCVTVRYSGLQWVIWRVHGEFSVGEQRSVCGSIHGFALERSYLLCARIRDLRSVLVAHAAVHVVDEGGDNVFDHPPQHRVVRVFLRDGGEV